MASLRDLGYAFPQAVAELIDNSIDAAATEVRVDIRFDGEDSWVRVADNGEGMTDRAIDEAMRFGSESRYASDALGGFGLGLKTASFSQCRRLYVASRRSPTGRVVARLWDMDEVAALDDWMLERPGIAECPPQLTAPLAGARGTVVVWEGLDRVLMYQNPFGPRAEAAIEALVGEVREHLAMVFHRFLAGEAARLLPLRLFVNDDPIEPWDPFARSESNTVALNPQTLAVELPTGGVSVVVRPYLLPGQHAFSTPDAHHAAGGPRKWNRQQGFYVYRADRLIQSGGWNRLRTQDEHTKLARVAIDVPRAADEAFGVNVSKMRVTIPAAIRGELRTLVTAISARAQTRYRTHPSDGARRRSTSSDRSAAVIAGDVDRFFAQADDFIPRSRVVELIRRELAGEPALIRRVVHEVLGDDWLAAANIDEAMTRAPAANGNGAARRR